MDRNIRMNFRSLMTRYALLVVGLLLIPQITLAQTTSTSEAVTSTMPIETGTSNGTDGSGAPVNNATDREGQYERGVVESVGIGASTIPGGAEQVKIYRVRFLSGPMLTQVREIRSDVGSNPYNIDPHAGDKVVVFMQNGEAGWNLYLEGFDRRSAMILLIVLFVLTLVLLSGWQGLKVAAGIAISIAMIGYILIPLYLRGVNAVPLAIVLAGLFTLISSALTMGWNRKTIVISVGTMGGALVAYFISLIFVDATRLSGISTEDDHAFFNKNPLLDPRGLLFAGIIIAAVGVLEDVAVSIASGVSEVRSANPKIGFRELFTAGMVIGRDHMGALANTLVFAYVGASLTTLLLYQQFGGSWLKFINFDSVTDEVVRSLAGTIGLVFTVPITALLATWAMLRAPVESKTHRH
ncbi:YibE/F family protein [Candidatus Uhrbacteria bacterium]|nr:YibE/F family protein [Candidatus Uhrbacteria bacterium]